MVQFTAAHIIMHAFVYKREKNTFCNITSHSRLSCSDFGT